MSSNTAGLFYENLTETSVVTATSEASADFVADNLKTAQLGEKWRSATNDDQTIIIDTQDENFIPYAGIFGHNFDTECVLRFRISNNADLSLPSYDAEYYAWPSIYGWDEELWDYFGWDGVPIIDSFIDTQRYTSIVFDRITTGSVVGSGASTLTLPITLSKTTGGEIPTNRANDYYLGGIITITAGVGIGQVREVTGYNGSTYVLSFDTPWSIAPNSTSEFELDMSQAIVTTVNDGTYNGRYLGITISNQSNIDGYVEAGWAGCGDFFQPGIDIDDSADSGVVDPSDRFIAYGQNPWVNQRTKFRTASFSFSFLTEYEARVQMQRLGYHAGNSRPVVYIPFVENTFRAYAETILGLLDSAPRIKQLRKDYTGTSYGVALSIRGLT